MFNSLQEALVALSQSWWVFPAVLGVCAVDGFFPPIPSETTVIAVASVFASNAEWQRSILLVAAVVLGASLGDNIAYWVGHFFHPRTWRPFTSGRGKHAYDFAEIHFKRQGAALLFAVRFVPIVRVAVNIVAGSLHYRWRRFVWIDLGASLMWAIYSVGIGLAGGSLLEGNPLIGVAIGIAMGVTIGAVVQRIISHRLGYKDGDQPDGEAGRA